MIRPTVRSTTAVLAMVAVGALGACASKDKSADSTPAAAPAATTPAAGGSPAIMGPTPQQGGIATPPGLEKKPDIKPGTGTVSKIVVTPLVKGTGPVVKVGQTITANYIVINYKTGALIDSSWGGEPFSAPIGVGQLIQGWDQAVPGQKVGSRLQLDIPAALAYGPSKGDLRFIMDILAAK